MKQGWLFLLSIAPIFIWPYIDPFDGPFDSRLFGAYRFLVATVLIALITAAFYGKQWVQVLGLNMSRKHIFFSALSFALSLPCFYWLIRHALSEGGSYYVPVEPAYFPDYYGIYPKVSMFVQRLTQPLNEEIVFRALLLGLLARLFSHRVFLAILAAVVFSCTHFVLYYFGVMATPLDITTLATLFFFSLAANALFLTVGHIGFGFAIHVAWNWWRFPGEIWSGNTVVNEAVSFNLIEGSWPVLLTVALVGLICFAGLEVQERRRSFQKR